MRIPLVDLGGQYQRIKPEIDAAIQRVLDRAQYILGPEVEALEREMAQYCQTAHAVAVASGTDALELALRAMGVGPGDEVISTPLTFFASSEAVAQVGAKPVFVDVDPLTCTMDPARIEPAITARTKAIIPVHLYGHPCHMSEILALAKRHRLKVLEDCAQATGAKDAGRRVGGLGDAGAFSFYPSKNLGAYGDGGMVVTNDAAIANEIRLLRFHGSRDRVWHVRVARNSRLDDIQAAVLRVKLKYLDAWNEARREHAQTYRDAFAARRIPSDIILPIERDGASHVYHLFAIRVPHRAALKQALAQRGVSTQIHYEVPLHLEPAFAGLGYQRGQFPIAERLADEVLSLPMYPELTPAIVEEVVRQLEDALSASSPQPASSQIG